MDERSRRNRRNRTNIGEEVTLWAGGAGLSLASGAAAIMTVGRKQSLFGVSESSSVIVGWMYFPSEGSPGREARGGSSHSTKRMGATIIYSVETVPNLTYWGVLVSAFVCLFGLVILLVLLYDCRVVGITSKWREFARYVCKSAI